MSVESLEEGVLSLYECPDCLELFVSLWDSGCDEDCPKCTTTCEPIEYKSVKEIFDEEILSL